MNPEDKNKLKRESRVKCQSCGKLLYYGEKVVLIQVGSLESTARYDRVRWNEKLFFHKDCDIAIPELR